MSDPLLGTPGPFEVRCDTHAEQPTCKASTPSLTGISSSTDDTPRRRYDCERYEICLGLAASLNWESFTCRGCNGQPSENLLWRARVTARKDSVAARLLKAPPIVPINSSTSASSTSALPAERETSSAN